MARTEKGIVGLLEQQLVESDTSTTEVGEQRERNHRYYSLQPFGNERKGESAYVSPDVLDSVEAKKALFSETFHSGRRLVKFHPAGGVEKEEADLRTAYVEKTLEDNDWYELSRDAWHDAFVAKRCVIHVEWDHNATTITEELDITGAAHSQVIQYLQQLGDVTEIDESQSQTVQQRSSMEPTYQGRLVVTRVQGACDMTLIQPERYYRDPAVAYARDGMWCSFEQDTARAVLIEKNFNRDQVDKLKKDYRWQNSGEDTARRAHDGGQSTFGKSSRDPLQETVSYFRTYTWLDLSEYNLDPDMLPEGITDGIHIYQIHWAQGEILTREDGTYAVEQVEEMPFFEWTEFKISHADQGIADADFMSHTQKTQSTLKRLIVDNQLRRNTSRYEAQHNAIKNPRELLENHIGGIIWSKQVGSVAPLATPELSPLTLPIIEMLNKDKENRSGVSELSKGMSTDAIRHQNAADMIERLTNASNRRTMRAARDFAKTFLVPLYRFIDKMGRENDKGTHDLETGGSYQSFTPGQVTAVDLPLRVQVAMTPDEASGYAQTLMTMHQVQSSDPTLSMLYGIQEKHALLDEVYDSLGIADSSPFLKRPDDPAVIQQMKMQQQMRQKQEQMQMKQTEFQEWLLESNDGRLWYEAQLKGIKEQTNATNLLADNSREDEKLQHQKVIDWQEIAIEREQKRAADVGG